MQSTTITFLGNVLKNSWWVFVLEWLICVCQPQGETSSAGEQLVSNKVDAITIEVGAVNAALIYFYRVAIMA